MKGLLLAAFALLAIHASWMLPLFESADEIQHLDVVLHYAEHGLPPDMGQRPLLTMYEGVQPPLYYAMAALACRALDLDGTRWTVHPTDAVPVVYEHGDDELRPYRGDVLRLHLLRLLNILCGLATILLTWSLAERLCRGTGMLAAALVALNPAFASMCGGISNDPLVAPLAAGALLMLTRETRTARRGFLLGALLGSVVMAKLSALCLLPLLVFSCRGWRAWLGAAAGVFVLCAPFFAWNLSTYGALTHFQMLSDAVRPETREVASFSRIFSHFLPITGARLVGTYGLFVSAGAYVKGLFLFVFGAGLLGLLLRRPAGEKRVALLFTAAVLLNLAAALHYYFGYGVVSGRYLYPSLGALAALLAWGLPRFLSWILIVALFLAGWHSQWKELIPAFWPLNHEGESYVTVIDRIASAPASEQDLTIELLGENPLRWQPAPDPDARYTVHLSAAGFVLPYRSWEDARIAVREEFSIPDAFWEALPADVPMEVTVWRLPGATGRIERSPTLSLSAPPPSR